MSDQADQNIDTAAGASGTDTGFNLTTGGLIAIAVAVGIVVILGVASTGLYFLAKRRNWQVRKTIARASRRLTGRSQTRQTKRHGAVKMQPPSTSRSRMRDLEKGPNVQNTNTVRTEARPAAIPKYTPPPRYTERL